MEKPKIVIIDADSLPAFNLSPKSKDITKNELSNASEKLTPKISSEFTPIEIKHRSPYDPTVTMPIATFVDYMDTAKEFDDISSKDECKALFKKYETDPKVFKQLLSSTDEIMKLQCEASGGHFASMPITNIGKHIQPAASFFDDCGRLNVYNQDGTYSIAPGNVPSIIGGLDNATGLFVPFNTSEEYFDDTKAAFDSVAENKKAIAAFFEQLFNDAQSYNVDEVAEF